MRELLRTFTALPFADDPAVPLGAGGESDNARPGSAMVWALAPLVGLVLGAALYVIEQIAIDPVGPLAAGAAVVLVLTALTGAVNVRGLGDVALQLARREDDRAAPPARPTGVAGPEYLVVLVMMAHLTLYQRVHVAPQMLLLIPVAALLAQSLLLTDADERVGLRGPSGGDRVAMVVLALLLLPAPLLLAGLSRTPFGFQDELAGPAAIVLGLIMLVSAVAMGMLTRAWLLARFGALDAAGWRVIGLMSETAALLALAIRVA